MVAYFQENELPRTTNTDMFEELSLQISKLLKSYRMLLVTAESCTGGWMAEAITSIPGSSAWFERGFVTYSDAAKRDLLSVKEETLLQAGAVSQETASEMAKGALLHSPAHISAAITGIAGPEGGSEQKPIGTVWIAWSAKGSDTVAQRFHFSGDRQSIRQQSVYAALNGLLTILLPPARVTVTKNRSHLPSPALLPPVITLDGPSGTGKGTLSHLIAKKLGWHYLDSGASFRVLAYAASTKNIDLQNENALHILAENLSFECIEDASQIKILLDGKDVTAAIRLEKCGIIASKIGVFPSVRQALLERQRAFRKWPGLVTDGRDMGTVIFPDAALKFFLYANLKERAARRSQQLKKKGMHVTFSEILQDLEERDKRDQERGIAPLKFAEDAFFIDTTELSIELSFSELMQPIKKVLHLT